MHKRRLAAQISSWSTLVTVNLSYFRLVGVKISTKFTSPFKTCTSTMIKT
uniref:Uncharacterized protein n=1 Tax=Setaria italica TaxID=4555 RepID=K3ZKZ5_SETIT